MFDAMSADDNRTQKARLDRRVAELAKLGQLAYAIREALGEYGVGQFDTLKFCTFPSLGALVSTNSSPLISI